VPGIESDLIVRYAIKNKDDLNMAEGVQTLECIRREDCRVEFDACKAGSPIIILGDIAATADVPDSFW
jgi:hypothetical protein